MKSGTTTAAFLGLFYCFCASAILFSDSGLLSGPLQGKLLDAPHQIYYCFPGFSARAASEPGLLVSTRAYYINEFRGYLFDPDNETLDEDGRLLPGRAEELTAMDYESLVLETEVSRQFGSSNRLGIVLRMYGYFGGVSDPLIEGFHSFFQLPNASREYFPMGGCSVSVKNSSGVSIELEGPALLFGDTELYGLTSIYASRESAMSLAWALELPTGRKGTPGGNGYPDAGIQLLWEKNLRKQFVLHLQQGIVIPGELIFPGSGADPYPVSQSLVALEWHPVALWSFILQARVHTSPLASDEKLNHSLFPWSHQFEMPVTSIMAGLKRSMDGWVLQAYFEEDALTHEGPDILFSLSMTRRYTQKSSIK